MRLLALYGSARRGGNSEQLLDRVLGDLPATRFYLSELHQAPFADLRHEPGGFPPLAGPAREILQAMTEHDVLLFACPVYWYGMSAQLKLLVDHWSHALRDPSLQFKERLRGKKAHLILTGGDRPRIKALPLVQQFEYALGFMGMELGEYIIGQGSKPGDVMQDERAVFQADWLHRQLAGE
jgi:NAD(P)H-dependent FMN reductase